jgi:hypothetical protein
MGKRKGPAWLPRGPFQRPIGSEREVLIVVDAPDDRLPLRMGVAYDDATTLGFSHDDAPGTLRDGLGVFAHLPPPMPFTRLLGGRPILLFGVEAVETQRVTATSDHLGIHLAGKRLPGPRRL